MDIKTRLVTAHVLRSKLMELDPPQSLMAEYAEWVRALENVVRQERSGGSPVSDSVRIEEHVNVELINVRGPKQ